MTKRSWIFWSAVILAWAWSVSALRVPAAKQGQFDTAAFGRLPVLSGGRLKPLDTMARSSLLVMHGKQTLRLENGTKLSATDWLLRMVFAPAQINDAPLFLIDNPDVLGLMGKQQERKRTYSYNDLFPHLEKIEEQMQRIEAVRAEIRSPYQRALAALAHNILMYQRLQNTLQRTGTLETADQFLAVRTKILSALSNHATNMAQLEKSLKAVESELTELRIMDDSAEFFPVPDERDVSDPHNWISMGRWVVGGQSSGGLPPAVQAYADMGQAFRANDPDGFNKAVYHYTGWLHRSAPGVVDKVRGEHLFNHAQLFVRAMTLYVLVFLLFFLSFFGAREIMNHTAYGLFLVALVLHTAGLVSRMYFQGRPPVTNLYSSAVFVGWMAALLGAVLEKFSKRGFVTAVSAAIGFITLIIAQHLMTQGDTMEMMRAVLDSNFWLATHVVTITIGYSSTYVSGMLGVLFLFRRWLDSSWSKETARHTEQLIFGVVCFSTFFSFLGTVLGGIWADQSWGRFWGWDPKENGALLIVLWNALILHARWGRLVRERGMAVLAVFGNIITTLSWFGVNMLGIGLHSYGFMDKAFVWLVVFCVSQGLIMLLALRPEKNAPMGNRTPASALKGPRPNR